MRIIDDEEYEKKENFFIVLEEPRWLKRGISGVCTCSVCVCVSFSVFLMSVVGNGLVLTGMENCIFNELWHLL